MPFSWFCHEVAHLFLYLSHSMLVHVKNGYWSHRLTTKAQSSQHICSLTGALFFHIHTLYKSRGSCRQRARGLAILCSWACFEHLMDHKMCNIRVIFFALDGHLTFIYILYFNTDHSKAVLLLWFLTVTCSCCLYLYFGSPIMWVTYFS